MAGLMETGFCRCLWSAIGIYEGVGLEGLVYGSKLWLTVWGLRFKVWG